MGRDEQDWRRPIRATGHTTPTLEVKDFDGMEQSGIFWNVQEQDDFDRIRNGLACGNCLTPFPARPDKATEFMFKGAMKWPEPGGEVAALSKVREGRCPICGFPVNPEAFEVQTKINETEISSYL